MATVKATLRELLLPARNFLLVLGAFTMLAAAITGSGRVYLLAWSCFALSGLYALLDIANAVEKAKSTFTLNTNNDNRTDNRTTNASGANYTGSNYNSFPVDADKVKHLIEVDDDAAVEPK